MDFKSVFPIMLTLHLNTDHNIILSLLNAEYVNKAFFLKILAANKNNVLKMIFFFNQHKLWVTAIIRLRRLPG